MMKNYLSNAAKELEVDEDLVEFVWKDMWNNVSYYLRNPQECIDGVYIKNFCKFKLSKPSIERKLKYLKNEESIKYHKSILNEFRD